MKEISRQEKFWAGDFGEQYIKRNNGDKLIAANTALFSTIIKSTENVKSITEFGANIGLNLIALHSLLPQAKITAVEINKIAAEWCSKLEYVNVNNMSIYDFDCTNQSDFVFTKGFLIHQNPDLLTTAYDVLYKTSNRYILLCEYYNPTPVNILYRGHSDVLFKRDFAGEILDRYSDLKLINYGFCYHRDSNYSMDDLSWFLLKEINTYENALRLIKKLIKLIYMHCISIKVNLPCFYDCSTEQIERVFLLKK